MVKFKLRASRTQLTYFTTIYKFNLNSKDRRSSPDSQNQKPLNWYLTSSWLERCGITDCKCLVLGNNKRLYFSKSAKTWYLKGEAILLSKSERARPTYFSPTSKPSNLPCCVWVEFFKSWNNCKGFTCLISSTYNFVLAFIRNRISKWIIMSLSLGFLLLIREQKRN